MRVVIIGGGISGLATAFFIQRQAPGSQVLVYEKESELGGTMRTVEKDGFLFETGANGFLSNRPDTLELVHAAGADHLLLASSEAARQRFIFTKRLHPLPEGPGAFLRSRLLGVTDKLRVLAEPLVPPRKNDDRDESLQSFGYRRLGRAFTDIFLDALAAGIHASTPARLSVQAAFPAVVRLEQDYGGLFKGMIKQRKKKAGPGGTLMSFRSGVSSFIEHLGAALGDAVMTDSEISELHPTRNGYLVRGTGIETEAEKVVIATPAFVSSRLLTPMDAELGAHLAGIDYSPIAVVGFGYGRIDSALQGFGLLTTEASRQDILGVLWDSSIFPDRAPLGKQSMRVLIGGQRAPRLVQEEDQELIEIALRGIEETMGLRQAPTVTMVERWKQGIPHYGLGHLKNVTSIFEHLQRYPGLYLNSNAYYGVGLNDCVTNSKKCAAEVIQGIGQRRT
jgi:oxygen-dependent protoporphyrinogen oxidase